ncbi:MAG: Na+/H+ antiporter NhaA [Bacteroidales bacterium]|nr:MAG: Na+/H+ antiporter NhaA [Bacteroidales bacterium]
MDITKLFNDFYKSEKTGGLILVLATLISLFLANSPFQIDYLYFWHHGLFGYSFVKIINDGLMTIFFLLIGLELEREIYQGELSVIKKASFPIFGAIGGMLVPALIYLFINFDKATQTGFGIPMATDIAFAIGILSLLGNRAPHSLKILLIAMAVIDDLGSIIIIAIFYSTSISLVYIILALSIFGVLLILNRYKVYDLTYYILGGIIMWFFMLKSGIHPTLAGVLLAFVIPFGDGGEKSPSFSLQHVLHKPVAFIILPLFAIANTCIIISDNWQNILSQSSNLGIILGLLIGKPLGIVLFSFIGVTLGLSSIPQGLKWMNILGIGILAGVGFTMSIFITLLAFDKSYLINSSKIAIIVASTIAGIIGFMFLRLTLKKRFES